MSAFTVGTSRPTALQRNASGAQRRLASTKSVRCEARSHGPHIPRKARSANPWFDILKKSEDVSDRIGLGGVPEEVAKDVQDLVQEGLCEQAEEVLMHAVYDVGDKNEREALLQAALKVRLRCEPC